MTRTYGSLQLIGKDWVMNGLEPHVVIRLKQLFPRIPKSSGGPYRFPADMTHAADLDWFASRYPLAMTERDAAALKDGRTLFENTQAEIERILHQDYTPPPFAGLREGQSLRPHQAKAAEVLQRVKGLLVGDDVGEGKTFTGAACALLPEALPAIVVCDGHLQLQWAERLEAFTTLTTKIINTTKPFALPACDVFIFRWTQLQGWADMWESIRPGVVIFDEMQELRTGKASNKGVSAHRLVAAARYRVGLTATPIYNYGVEMWQVMQFLRPDLLGSYDEFMREWAPAGPIKDPKALGSMLRENYAFVRKTKDGDDKVNRLVREVEHDEATMADFEALARKLAVSATSGSFVQRGEATRELDLRARQATGIAKARQVASVVRILAESGTPLLLAGWHREVYRIWLEELADLKPAMFTGSESPAQKEREKRRFLDGDTNVFVLSLRSGRGVDGLQARSNFVVFGELDWSPGVHAQVIGRLDREGQDANEITALYLVCDDGSDPPMMEVLGLKASQATQIIDPHLGVTSTKTDGSHMRALVERYLVQKGAAA